jgi:hypothetical protein
VTERADKSLSEVTYYYYNYYYIIITRISLFAVLLSDYFPCKRVYVTKLIPSIHKSTFENGDSFSSEICASTFKRLRKKVRFT